MKMKLNYLIILLSFIPLALFNTSVQADSLMDQKESKASIGFYEPKESGNNPEDSYKKDNSPKVNSITKKIDSTVSKNNGITHKHQTTFPAKLLPKTNDMNNKYLVIIGGILIALVVNIFKKRKREGF